MLPEVTMHNRLNVSSNEKSFSCLNNSLYAQYFSIIWISLSSSDENSGTPFTIAFVSIIPSVDFFCIVMNTFSPCTFECNKKIISNYRQKHIKIILRHCNVTFFKRHILGIEYDLFSVRCKVKNT